MNVSNDRLIIPKPSSFPSFSGARESMVSRIGVNQPASLPLYWELPQKVSKIELAIQVFQSSYLVVSILAAFMYLNFFFSLFSLLVIGFYPTMDS